MPLLWTVLTVVFALAEAATAQLVGIWFSGAAFITLVFTLIGLKNATLQCCVFIFFSVLLLILTRPIAKKITAKNALKTNAASLIGKSALVVDDIDNLSCKGRVKINGMTWSARSTDGGIAQGKTVIITDIEGVKLIVKKIEED